MQFSIFLSPSFPAIPRSSHHPRGRFWPEWCNQREAIEDGAGEVGRSAAEAAGAFEMTPKQAVAFVAAHGVVLESAQGSFPSLAEAVAGAPIRGSYWAHPKANDIFLCSRAVRESADVLVCRLVDGKVSYVHRRLWPALVRLAGRFGSDQLAAIQEVHTPAGKHEVHTTVYPDWVTEDVRRAAEGLSEKEAAAILPELPARRPPDDRRKGRRKKRPSS
jgi:hypothetical protein